MKRLRRLLPLLTLPVALLGCGKAAPSADSSGDPIDARAHDAAGCPAALELSRVRTVVRSGHASLSWQIATTADVRDFLVERKLSDGRWRKYSQLPVDARSAQLASLPDGPAELRVLAVLKPRATRPQGRAAQSRLAPGAIAVGLNGGGWGPCEPPEMSTEIKYIRVDSPTTVAPWTSVGLNVIADLSGPYDDSGVSGVDVAAYVRRVVKLVEASPDVWAIEVLNEPGNLYFWGKDAESPANRTAYAKLIVAVHDALVARFGARRPLILASYDGGIPSNAWGEAWAQDATALADADMLTEHPYGVSSERASAALGNRANVEAAHAQTGKPIAVTEVGWPTDGAVGEGALKYSEAEEAENIAAFVGWAHATGYVKVVTVYNYRDTADGGGGYGVQTHQGTKKLAWFALAKAARQAGS
jgi:hypothetical protein